MNWISHEHPHPPPPHHLSLRQHQDQNQNAAEWSGSPHSGKMYECGLQMHLVQINGARQLSVTSAIFLLLYDELREVEWPFPVL
jgi:hypothetical protein